MPLISSTSKTPKIQSVISCPKTDNETSWRPLTFDVVCMQIDTYEAIYQDVETVEGSIIFEKWFRIDSRPFRQALLNIVKKWSLMFKQHLIDHVTNRCVQQKTLNLWHFTGFFCIKDFLRVFVLRKLVVTFCQNVEWAYYAACHCDLELGAIIIKNKPIFDVILAWLCWWISFDFFCILCQNQRIKWNFIGWSI